MVSILPSTKPAVLTPPDTSNVMAVLFADIAGSTKLYDTLGDVRAKQMVDECIALMRATVEQYSGRVIKTIGDEVMCVLPNADAACLAATDMQLKVAALPVVAGVRRAIRVGFHVGPVIAENNDVFGDTVNLAARMTGIAKALQIITTHSAMERISPLLRASSRGIAALAVKGKEDEVEVCEILWQSTEELTMATPSLKLKPNTLSLHLLYADLALNLDHAGPTSIVLGRDASCEGVVADRMASRQHARIERRQGKFFLIDQSTNGTFVQVPDEAEIVLRREEMMLRGAGHIALGHSVSETSESDRVAFAISLSDTA